jgi:hypothetical protein
LATFLHYTFALTPEGQYILKLLESIHKLVPYGMIKQTFRLANAATMINAMMKLLLAKLSLTSFTNMVGLTNREDDGMNLLQRYVLPLCCIEGLRTSCPTLFGPKELG